MAINEITGANMTTKPSATYSDKFDNIFRNKKVYYAIEYIDGMQDYITFDSDDVANEYHITNKNTIKIFEKQQLLQE